MLRHIGKSKSGNVYLVFKEGLGIVAVKFMKNSDFDSNEWKVGLDIGRLKSYFIIHFLFYTLYFGIYPNREDKNPYVLKYIEQFSSGDVVGIVLEYANMGPSQSDCEEERYSSWHCSSNYKTASCVNEKNIMLHNPPGSGRVLIKISGFEVLQQNHNDQQSSLMEEAEALSFIAPEVMNENMDNVKREGKVLFDDKIDVWPVGILLYHIVSHSFPFETSSLIDTNKKPSIQNLIRPTSVDDQLWDLLTKMLRFDSKDRISSSEALKHEYFTGDKAGKEVPGLAICLLYLIKLQDKEKIYNHEIIIANNIIETVAGYVK
ncbi:MAG: hypothetical protein EZS28_005768 [Streblomastix strix]|uniref:Protein kinase domain-containing protein n=1 Tax=Streblomastix strix TaxID=222440 RepID=A0A5J4WW20_9EUKA|nr:MAG: hypothetical protein EZS28_005768 [Streblomastix strix]